MSRATETRTSIRFSVGNVPDYVFHFTDEEGYKAIRSQVEWIFQAEEPPGNHPRGAYFTTLNPSTPKLAKRLGLPNRKIAFVFCVLGAEGLLPLDGGRGEFIFYSPVPYCVVKQRQVFGGSLVDARVKFP